MKPTKFLMCALAVGAVALVTSNVFAIQGKFTVSGTALSQNTKNSYDVVTKTKLTQKGLLTLLAQATGDTSITNKKTVLLYDPDAFNENAFGSNEGFSFYGVFYYSNSVAGLTPLDGVDGDGGYYSYIELDYANWLSREYEGFSDSGGMEFNGILAESRNKENATGNAILYIHSDGYAYDLPDGNFYYANDWDIPGGYQQYAFVMHGIIQYGGSSNSTTMSESANLSGSGDGLYDYNDLVVSGKATFKAKGPAPK
jgi:hypothetical protein